MQSYLYICQQDASELSILEEKELGKVIRSGRSANLPIQCLPKLNKHLKVGYQIMGDIEAVSNICHHTVKAQMTKTTRGAVGPFEVVSQMFANPVQSGFI